MSCTYCEKCGKMCMDREQPCFRCSDPNYKELTFDEFIAKNPAPKGKVYKSDGNCNPVLVDDPNNINNESKFRKKRNPMNHLKPKKKKRK